MWKAKANCGRIYSHILTINSKDWQETFTRSKWHIVGDESTNYIVSNMYDTKSSMTEPTCAKIEKWHQANMQVVWQGNAWD